MIDELPERVLSRSQSGFEILSKMSEVDRRAVLQKFVDAFARGVELDNDWLDTTGSITHGEASTLLTTLSVPVAFLSQYRDGIEEFLAAARGKLFEESLLPTAREVADIISQDRARISTALTRRALSVETLPALEAFNVSVDYRFRFNKDNEIEIGVPVAIVHVDTDTDARLFLQMSTGDVEMLIGKLDKVLKQMAAATERFEKSGSQK
jgi:hypothetical protein